MARVGSRASGRSTIRADLTSFGFGNVVAGFNADGITAAGGDNALFVAVGDTMAGLYCYEEDGSFANSVSFSEMSLLAMVDATVFDTSTTGDFVFA